MHQNCRMDLYPPVNKAPLLPFVWVILMQILFVLPLSATPNTSIPKPPHYRGLYVTAANHIWISGTQGRVLRIHAPNIETNTKTSHTTTPSEIQFHIDTFYTPFPNKDFRDIWALDDQTAVAMSIADSAVIIKTQDGGRTWKTVYHNETPGIFLDVIDIDPKTGIGIVLGDPLSDTLLEKNQSPTFTTDNQNPTTKQHGYSTKSPNNTHKSKHFIALFTTDFGSHWIQIPLSNWSIPVDTLESFFAASGTSLQIISSDANPKRKRYSLTVGFAGGGEHPQFHITTLRYSTQKKPTDQWKFQNLPTQPMGLKGGSAWGCYGLTIHAFSKGIAVGGNYAVPNFRGDSTGAVAVYTNNILNKWNPSITPPMGYRSGVCISSPINKDSLFRWFFTDRQNHCESFTNAYGEFPVAFFFERNHGKNVQLAVCTGTNGTDISFDCGIHWMPLSFERGFNACTWGCEHLVLVGNSGKVRMMSLKDIVSQFKSIHPSNPTRN